MTEDRLFAPGRDVVENALIDDDGYRAMYADSIADPAWQADRLDQAL